MLALSSSKTRLKNACSRNSADRMGRSERSEVCQSGRIGRLASILGISHRQRERSSPLLPGQHLFEKSLAENHLPSSGRRCASPAGSRQVLSRGDFQGAVSLRQKTVSRPRTRRRPRDNAGVAMQVSPMVFFANSRYSGPAAST